MHCRGLFDCILYIVFDDVVVAAQITFWKLLVTGASLRTFSILLDVTEVAICVFKVNVLPVLLTIEHTDVEEHGTLYDWVEQISNTLSREIREGMFFINWMLGAIDCEVKGTNMLDPFCTFNMVAHS